jgi:hypothetical protein
VKVFISWSGERSKAVAEALHYWLPKVIQVLEPWLSAADIDKGTRWRSEITNELEQSDIGIICLTPENLTIPWILFEAGALSKKQQNAYVCTFLYDLNPADVKEPLAQFQATKATEDDIRRLIKTINSVLPQSRLSESDITEIFNVWWPELEKRLENIPKPKDKLEAQREEREILEEILESVRALLRERAKNTRLADNFILSFLPAIRAAAQKDASLELTSDMLNAMRELEVDAKKNQFNEWLKYYSVDPALLDSFWNFVMKDGTSNKEFTPPAAPKTPANLIRKSSKKKGSK